MATKMHKKSKLQYKDGYIVKDNKVLSVDNKIVDLFNKLEHDYQKALWERKKATVNTPSFEGEFEFETERGNVIPVIIAETPVFDEHIEQAMKLMHEIDLMENADKMNEYMKEMQPIVQFIKDKRIVCCDQSEQHRFDLKNIGNPLELDIDTFSDIVCSMFED